MSISYDYYRTFYYVAKYGNITAAANALFLSQPTVSRCIQNLEQELGCQLFIRTKKGVLLTPEANLLYRYVSRAHRSLAQAEEELTETKAMSRGNLRIAATEMTLQNFLMPYLNQFHSRWPSIKLQISNGTTSDALRMLSSNLADLAIVTSPLDTDQHFLVKPLSPIRDVLIAGNQYEYLRDRLLHLEDIVDCPIICIKKGLTTRAFLDNFFEQHQLLLDPDIEVATTELITPMVVLNMGIGIVPLRLAQKEIDAGNVFPLTLAEDFPSRDICLVSHADRPLSIAGRKFTELLEAVG